MDKQCTFYTHINKTMKSIYSKTLLNIQNSPIQGASTCPAVRWNVSRAVEYFGQMAFLPVIQSYWDSNADLNA